ncbi:MAG: thioredoxin domain-containing protein, partial [Gemmatimonadaceae bacterium]
AAGPANAPVTLVEYGDYECSHCGAAHPIVLSIRKQFAGTLRFVFRNFPLREAHPHAAHAAEAAEAVAELGGNESFWKMHDLLYDNQDALDDESLVRYATSAGVDGDMVRNALAARTYSPRVRADFNSGVRSGVNGTPTFFINGVRFDGNWQDEDDFAAALEAAAADHR